jgi:hypothetical protein
MKLLTLRKEAGTKAADCADYHRSKRAQPEHGGKGDREAKRHRSGVADSESNERDLSAVSDRRDNDEQEKLPETRVQLGVRERCADERSGYADSDDTDQIKLRL